jgi:hypothetical protein
MAGSPSVRALFQPPQRAVLRRAGATLARATSHSSKELRSGGGDGENCPKERGGQSQAGDGARRRAGDKVAQAPVTSLYARRQQDVCPRSSMVMLTTMLIGTVPALTATSFFIVD